METGSFHIEETNYSAASMLSDITTCGRYYAEKKDIELRVSFDPDIPKTLAGDSMRITRIFSNLLSNAVKYTDSGWVEISVKWEGQDEQTGCLCAHVRDTGIGMKEEDIARISSSFLRLDKKRNQNIHGLGRGHPMVTRHQSRSGHTRPHDAGNGRHGNTENYQEAGSLPRRADNRDNCERSIRRKELLSQRRLRRLSFKAGFQPSALGGGAKAPTGTADLHG